MKITLNNRLEEIPAEQISVSELLALKKYSFRMLVIKINGTLIRKEEYNTSLISEGDDVMVLHLISGG